ncbi:MAG: aspartate-semialdehyde dehydrogenase [Actinobacteria bacterium]|nr:MAG: aspartate-semialdehyde dehydrogenase [Actinomycetota bacterium]
MLKINVAVVGATGVVGQEIIKVLEQRKFGVSKIKFLASERSAGRRVSFERKGYTVEALDNRSFKGVDLALFSAGSDVSKEFAPIASKSGCLVIDNSSAFRMDKEVPLMVPEVNPEALKKAKGIIANPNCSTVQMVVVLKPLHDFGQIKRVIVTTFQAVSGTGADAVVELNEQLKAYCQHKEINPKVYPYQIALNVFPHIDVFMKDGSTKEEEKMVKETKKILSHRINVNATTVRVPVLIGHSESINIETVKEIKPEKARKLLDKAKSVQVIDDPEENKYPMPLSVSGTDDCYVGRIRRDSSIKNGLSLWVVADNLRKGAALNAVQIAELALEKKLIGN